MGFKAWGNVAWCRMLICEKLQVMHPTELSRWIVRNDGEAQL